ncbi:MAG: hypothetical protein LLG00_13640 [Planctomycetaceae bacterium]|nr:hypothetical protein [Planctomycetaceae bacterium]
MAQIKFWNLRSPPSTIRLAEWASGEMDLEGIVCPIHEGHRAGGKRLTDLSIALPRRTIRDFVWTWHSECVLQDRVLELFKKHGFTGFDVKPVKAKFKRVSDCQIPRLWELLVSGWAGMASPESGITLIERCEGCGHTVYSGSNNSGTLIDISQWDGSDFFIVWPLPRFIFVTDRVAQAIRDNRLTGAVLTEPKALDLSGGLLGSFSPGRLSDALPDERARQLGTALGID